MVDRCAAIATAWCILWGACSAIVDDFSTADGDTSAMDTGEFPNSTKESSASTDENSPPVTDSGASSTAPGSDGTDGADSTDAAPGCREEQTPAGAITWCSVPAGTFSMGCPEDAACLTDETPAHLVYVSAFSLMQYEVTSGQFAAFVQDQPQWAPGGAAAQACATYLPSWYQGAPPPEEEPLPVSSVCWYAARAFCQWLGADVDLPTEAQWERAAKGDHDGVTAAAWRYPFGDAIDCALANTQGCAGAVLAPGTTLGRSPFGVADLAGNAMEWTRDGYRGDYYCDPDGAGNFAAPDCNTAYTWRDPQGDASATSKSVRGGSWYSPVRDAQVWWRAGHVATTGSNLIGFRCARSAP